MARDPKALAWGALSAARRIGEFTAGKELADYAGSEMLRSAVERQFEILGEALRQARTHFPELARRVSRSREISAFRNRLIHGYATVSNEVVWGVIEGELVRLREELEQILGESSPPSQRAGGGTLSP